MPAFLVGVQEGKKPIQKLYMTSTTLDLVSVRLLTCSNLLVGGGHNTKGECKY